MFCGWFSGVLWWMSPCQWISANLSNFEMILFSTWLYSSQTKLCSHLKLPCFGYLFFHTESLPLTSFCEGFSPITTCYHFLCRSLFSRISPLSGLFLMVFAGNSIWRAQLWGSRAQLYFVISTQSTWIESRREYEGFFLERKQGEGTACKRITMFSPLFSCRFADSTGIPLPAAAALPWLPNGTHSESSKVGPHPLF